MVQLLDHFLLHDEERVPAPDQQPLPPVARRFQGYTQVAGDGVVHRGHQRQAHVLDVQHAVAEALVVMDEVVLARVLAQVAHRPPPEGVGLGKAAGEFAAPLDDIAQGSQVARAQRQQAILEQVQAGQLDEAHPRIQVRIGGARYHVHLVPSFNQRLAEIAQVDALATGIGLAAVAQQRDAQRAGRILRAARVGAGSRGRRIEL